MYVRFGLSMIGPGSLTPACARAQQWQPALALLERMEARGPIPSVITYNTVISAMEKGHQWAGALEVLERLEARGLRPDRISFNAAIAA